MIIALTALLFAILAGVFVWRPMWGFYALVFTLPFEWIGSWPLNLATGHPVTDLSEVTAAAWILAVGYAVARKRLRLEKPARAWYLLAAFMCWSALSALLIGHGAVLESYVEVVELFAISTTIALTYRNVSLARFIDALMASAGLVCLFGIYQFVLGTFRVMNIWTGLRAPYIRDLFGFPRIHSVTLEPLYFANYLLIPLLLGLALLILRPKLLASWHRVVLILTALDFILTMSRGAIIALVISLIVAAFGLVRLRTGERNLKPVWQAATVIVLVGACAIGAASYVATRNPLTGLSNFGDQLTVNLFSTDSFTDRVHQSGLGLAIAESHPIFGVGLAGVTPFVHGYAASRHPNDVIALNNQFVELLAETGIVGTLLYYIFLVTLLWQGWRRYPKLSAPGERALLFGAVICMLAMTIQAQSFTGFFLVPYWTMYGLLLGLEVQPMKRKKESG